jgi:hypothetical protein
LWLLPGDGRRLVMKHCSWITERNCKICWSVDIVAVPRSYTDYTFYYDKVTDWFCSTAGIVDIVLLVLVLMTASVFGSEDECGEHATDPCIVAVVDGVETTWWDNLVFMSSHEDHLS